MTTTEFLVMPQETPEAIDKQQILKERARVLARTDNEVQAEESLDVVEFLLAHEHYAVEMSCVVEVYPLKELTPLPCTPDFMRGVVNVRGQIVAIIDIKSFFHLPDNALTNLNRIIIIGGSEINGGSEVRLGVLVDEVLGVRSVPLSALQASLPTLGGIGAEYLRGITDERLMVLDAGRILSDEKLIINEEVEAG